ncbi:hypothetical protein AB0K00_27505 [Dactylosporangium sp. NPDC049525]|uniref:hypothetical protein n=1 Tax=Dactylosporangium sp. NPDC049525 TaxID=3154730 RepID=UPI00341F1B08
MPDEQACDESTPAHVPLPAETLAELEKLRAAVERTSAQLRDVQRDALAARKAAARAQHAVRRVRRELEEAHAAARQDTAKRWWMRAVSTLIGIVCGDIPDLT